MKMFETNTLQIEKFCKKNRICKLAFFGSAVRKDFMPNSDIDVLVEFIE
jgi:predicted nucleotidyltransferase